MAEHQIELNETEIKEAISEWLEKHGHGKTKEIYLQVPNPDDPREYTHIFAECEFVS